MSCSIPLSLCGPFNFLIVISSQDCYFAHLNLQKVKYVFPFIIIFYRLNLFLYTNRSIKFQKKQHIAWLWKWQNYTKFTSCSHLLPSWQVVKDPFHSKFSMHVLSLEPCNTNPYWQENRTLLPTVKSPKRSPLLGLPGSGHCFSGKVMQKSRTESFKQTWIERLYTLFKSLGPLWLIVFGIHSGH